MPALYSKFNIKEYEESSYEILLIEIVPINYSIRRSREFEKAKLIKVKVWEQRNLESCLKKHGSEDANILSSHFMLTKKDIES